MGGLLLEVPSQEVAVKGRVWLSTFAYPYFDGFVIALNEGFILDLKAVLVFLGLKL